MCKKYKPTYQNGFCYCLGRFLQLLAIFLHVGVHVTKWCTTSENDPFTETQNRNIDKPFTIYCVVIKAHNHMWYQVYSKTSLTDHLHKSAALLYRSLYFGPKRSPVQIFYLRKPTQLYMDHLKSVRWSVDSERFYCICY